MNKEAQSFGPAGPCVSLVTGKIVATIGGENIKPRKKRRPRIKSTEPREQRRGQSKNKLPVVAHGSLGNPHWVAGFRVLYLSVPYGEREEAKRLGAKWNPDRKAWWVLAAGDLMPFQRWLPASTRNPTKKL